MPKPRTLSNVRHGRPRVSCLAWTALSGRQAEVAAALDGEPAVFYSLGRAPDWVKPLRYLVSLLQSSLYLLRRRPRAVIVTNPPVLAALPAFAYGRVARVPVLLDSHPGGFGLQGDTLSARLQPLHRRLVARADATLVTAQELADRVRAWGGRGELLHEAPPPWDAPPANAPRAGAFTVVFVCVFQRDEPVHEVVEAARRLPDVRIRITGDLRHRPADLGSGTPPNVEWTGFLGPDDYREALFAADAVVVLSTEPTSVPRGAYEATWAGRPLVLTDWPGLRKLFPEAVHVGNDAEAIARGIAEARARHAELRAAAPRARELQLHRWNTQLHVLEKLIGGHA